MSCDVDSAIWGKKAEFSFFCTVVNEPKSGLNSPLAPNQMKITIRAVKKARRGFFVTVTTTIKSLSDW